MAIPDSIPPMPPEMPPPPREDVPTREPDQRDMPDSPTPPAPGEEDLPDDVEPGSDADIDRDCIKRDEGNPGDLKTNRGTGQVDDNIDDLGRRPDGTTQDQPGAEGAGDDQQ